MVSNLNEGWNNKRNVFDTRETYNNAYGYSTRTNEGEKAILDAYWNKRMG